MAGKMADLCRFVIAALCGPVPGGVSGRARDVESRTILVRLALLLVVLGISGCSPWQPWNDLVLPPDAKIVQHTVLHADFDKSAAFCLHFNRNLINGTSNTTSAHLHIWHNIMNSLLKNLLWSLYTLITHNLHRICKY